MDYNKFPQMVLLSESMRRFEGGGPGACNPGNIKCPVDRRDLWNHAAIGQADGFCNFPSLTVGINAHFEKLYNICIGASDVYNTEAKNRFGLESSRDLTILQMISIYAPKEDGNDPDHYATTVCQWSNLKVDMLMSMLIVTSTFAVAIPTKPIQSPTTNIQIPVSLVPTASSSPEIPESWFQKFCAFIILLFSGTRS